MVLPLQYQNRKSRQFFILFFLKIYFDFFYHASKIIIHGSTTSLSKQKNLTIFLHILNNL